MRKYLITLLWVITSLSVFGQTFTVDNIDYTVISTNPNEVKVTGGTNIPADLVIPEVVINDGVSFNVTLIGNLAFFQNSLTSVLIPNSVTSIGSLAFSLGNLTSIVIPNSVTSIGGSAFRSNNLTSIVIPDSVTSIGANAFRSNQLTSVVLGDSVTSIGSFAFADNQNLAVATSNNPIPPVYATTAFNNTGIRKALTVPEGREEAYTQADWRSDFFIINGLAEAGATFTEAGITFKVNLSDPSTLEIIDNTNNGTVVIPSSSLGLSVTIIGANAFKNNNLTSIEIPDSIVAIGANAFRDNSLTSIEIPDSITTIENSAFRNNSLTSIQIPSSVASISAGAFRNNNLTTVFIEEGVTSIEASAFRDNAITSISLPETLTVIRRNAFRNNNSLTSITLPSSVTNMGADIFTGTSLEALTVLSAIPSSIETSSFGGNRNAISVTVPSAGLAAYLASARWANNPENDFFNINEIYTGPIPNTFEQNSIKYNVTGSNPNILEVKGLGVGVDNLSTINIPAIVTERDIVFTPTRIDTDAFNNKNVTTLNVSENLEVIAVRAFANNSDLTSVRLPATLTAIGGNAFANTSLETVISLNTTPPTIQGNSFGDRSSIVLTIPFNVTQDYLEANWTGFASIDESNIDIGDTFESGDFLFEVTSISPNEVVVIDLVTTTTAIVIPTTVFEPSGTDSFSVTSIGDRAFSANRLINVIIPDSVISIGERAFAFNELEVVIIPNSVAIIENAAFRGNNLETLTIPNSVISIGDEAFSANDLTEVVIPNNVTSIGRVAFARNQLTSIVIPNSITTIEIGTFAFNNLETVTIPNGIISIGDQAFVRNQLTNVIIPNSVTSIGAGAFLSNQLTNVIIPNNVITIEDSTFSGNELTSIIIPNGVISIGDQAFIGNQLTSVVIPNSVTSIEASAFRNNQLTSVTIPSSITSIGSSAFDENLLTSVIAEGTTPAAIFTGSGDSFGNNRSEIDLTVPTGTVEAYLNAEWVGFASVSDGDLVVGDVFESGDFLFEVISLSPNEVTVIDLVSPITDIEIPNTVFEPSGVVSFFVTAVGDEAFRQKQLISASIPDSVRLIGTTAFAENALTSVVIPSSVTNIGIAAFASNELINVVISNGITSIETGAFLDNQLDTVIIPNSVESIGSQTFDNNPLTSVIAEGTIPATVVTGSGDSFGNRSVIELTVPIGTIVAYLDTDWIGFASINDGGVAVGGTFEVGDFIYEITNLNPSEVGVIGLVTPITILEIPSGVSDTKNEFIVTAIGENAFSESGITSVVIPNTILTIGDAAFLDNALSSVTIPNSVTSIGVASFAKNFLESITIPASMTSIGNEAFGKNPLTEMNSLGIEPAAIFGDTFGDRSLINLTIPEGTLESYIAEDWIGFASVIQTGVNLGDTFESGDFLFEVTSLGPNEVAVIALINDISSVEIPSSTLDGDANEFIVTAIGEAAFVSRDIVQVFIPDSVIFIGVEAFAGNIIERLRLGAGIVTIEKAAFDKNNLTNIFIPESVTFIGDVAFNNNSLTTVTSEGTNPAIIFEDTFGDRSQIDLTIPLDTFEAYVEAEWTGFKTVTETEIDSGNRSNEATINVEAPLAMALGIDNTLASANVSLFINNDGILHIETGNAGFKGYTIYNMFGFQVAQGRENTVSIAHLSRGIYIVHVDFLDAERIVKKIIK